MADRRTAPAAAEPEVAEASTDVVEKLAAAAQTAAAEHEAAQAALVTLENELAEATTKREEAEDAFGTDAGPWTKVNAAIEAENKVRVRMNTARRAATRAAQTMEAAQQAATLAEVDQLRELARWDGMFDRALPVASRVAAHLATLFESMSELQALIDEQNTAVREGRERVKRLGIPDDFSGRVKEGYGRALVSLVLAKAGRELPVPSTLNLFCEARTIPTDLKAISHSAGLPLRIGSGSGSVSAHFATSDLHLVEEGLRGRWTEVVCEANGPKPRGPTSDSEPLVTDAEVKEFFDHNLTDAEAKFFRPSR